MTRPLSKLSPTLSVRAREKPGGPSEQKTHFPLSSKRILATTRGHSVVSIRRYIFKKVTEESQRKISSWDSRDRSAILEIKELFGAFFKPDSRRSGMKLTAWSLLPCLLLAILFLAASTSAYPASNPEIAIENMRQIPQWHCLRYRKFDLVRRCRNYRLGRKP